MLAGLRHLQNRLLRFRRLVYHRQNAPFLVDIIQLLLVFIHHLFVALIVEVFDSQFVQRDQLLNGRERDIWSLDLLLQSEQLRPKIGGAKILRRCVGDLFDDEQRSVSAGALLNLAVAKGLIHL